MILLLNPTKYGSACVRTDFRLYGSYRLYGGYTGTQHMSERIKLTKAKVDAAAATGQLYFMWDSELSGFALQVTPAGAKSFVVKYRIGGESRRKVIGKYGPAFPVEVARKVAMEELGKVKVEGVDVAKVAAELRTEAPLKDAMRRWLVDHVMAKRKPRTAAEYTRLVEKHILPTLGGKKLSQIVVQDVEALHARIGRDHKRNANHILAVLSSFYGWHAKTTRTKLAHGDPTKGIEKFEEKGRERFLSNDEFTRIGAALQGATNYSAFARSAIILLILTGGRKQEILKLEWQHVDLERGILFLSDSKTGAKPIVLSGTAIDILNRLPRVEGNPYVFPGGIEGQQYKQLQKVWAGVRKAAGVDNVRLHDLRHSFASVAVAANHSLPIIGKQLGHASVKTTERYAHLATDPVRAMTDDVGERVGKLLGHKPHE